MEPERIIPASYWVTDRLAAGQYPGSLDPGDAVAKVACFAQAGVTTNGTLLSTPDLVLSPVATGERAAGSARRCA